MVKLDKPRINFYFNIKVKDIDDKNQIKNQIFDEVIKRSRVIRDKYNDYVVRLYHCCFSEDTENIEYYSSKEGFKNDEGMYVIKKEFKYGERLEVNNIEEIDFVYLQFENEDEIIELVEKQNKVFTSGYSVENLKNLKKSDGCFSIAAKHKEEIVGNIVIVIKEDESKTKYGWVDDLFVSRELRKFGIGKNLILRAFNELIELDVKESRLEVWSNNERALSVYKSVGYEFYKQTECSIGMFI